MLRCHSKNEGVSFGGNNTYTYVRILRDFPLDKTPVRYDFLGRIYWKIAYRKLWIRCTVVTNDTGLINKLLFLIAISCFFSIIFVEDKSIVDFYGSIYIYRHGNYFLIYSVIFFSLLIIGFLKDRVFFRGFFYLFVVFILSEMSFKLASKAFLKDVFSIKELYYMAFYFLVSCALIYIMKCLYRKDNGLNFILPMAFGFALSSVPLVVHLLFSIKVAMSS